MVKIWCMNLIDNRNKSKRNKDDELKFRLCKEKGIIAIGWGVTEPVNSWQEYLEVANNVYKGNGGYSAARNALPKMSCGDLVWTKNPVTGDAYIVEITDKSAEPSIYGHLTEFDICAYKRGRYFHVDSTCLAGSLCADKLKTRKAIAEMHRTNRQDTFDATLKLFAALGGKLYEKD